MVWNLPATSVIGAGGAGGSNYQIERSLRFNRPDFPYLTRTPATAGNRDVLTFSCWLKRSQLGTFTGKILEAIVDANNRSSIDISNDTITLLSYVGAGPVLHKVSSLLLRDPGAWFALTVQVNTPASAYRVWINGQEITSWTTNIVPAAGTDTWFNAATFHYISRYGLATGFEFDGYMANIHLVDGQALDPSSFGEIDTPTGVWVPKAYSGSYGTNGFHLKFADNSNTTAATLGKDSSPNGNNWTPNNFSVAAGVGNDSLVDTPTNYGTDTGVGGEVRGNYCTLNPLDNRTGMPVQDGNLKAFAIAGGAHHITPCTFTITSGKWYWETTVIGTNNTSTISTGLVYSPSKASAYTNLPASTADDGVSLQMTSTNSAWWNKYGAGNVSLTGMSFAANDVAQIAVDMDANKAWVGKNGTWFSATLAQIAAGTNQVNTGTLSNPGTPFVGCGTSIDTLVVNFGQRPWAFTCPSGFKALCTQNLPDPAIVKPSQYFDINLRTGTGAPFSVDTMQAFAPDLVIVKNRIGATDNFGLYDTARGPSKELYLPATAAESVQAGSIDQFDADGFTATVGTWARTNVAAGSFVNYMWKKGVTPGFDVVTFTANASAGQQFVPHSLGVIPNTYIIRSRDAGTASWAFWMKDMDQTNNSYLLWNGQGARTVTAGFWGSGPTSTQLSVNVGASAIAGTLGVLYAWADIPGFSRIGIYTGNGSADGTFVWCGFRPKFLMYKDASAAGAWVIVDASRDPYNPVSKYLMPDSGAAEASLAVFDFTSNGFKNRLTGGAGNVAGNTVFYMAFAENPSKYARAR